MALTWVASKSKLWWNLLLTQLTRIKLSLSQGGKYIAEAYVCSWIYHFVSMYTCSLEILWHNVFGIYLHYSFCFSILRQWISPRCLMGMHLSLHLLSFLHNVIIASMLLLHTLLMGFSTGLSLHSFPISIFILASRLQNFPSFVIFILSTNT